MRVQSQYLEAPPHSYESWGWHHSLAGSCYSTEAEQDSLTGQIQQKPRRAFAASFEILATQTQTTDQRGVTGSIFTLQVIQQLTTLVNHADQTTT